MNKKQVGECDSLRGTLDTVPYDIFSMRKPDYIMKLMSTYGGLTVPNNQRESRRTWQENEEIKIQKSSILSHLQVILTTDMLQMTTIILGMVCHLLSLQC